MRTAALVIVMASFATGCASLPSRTVEVNGGGLEIAQGGAGPVTVVFQSGLGDGSRVWSSEWRPATSFAHAFAYNRPGYDGNAGTGAPRDPCTIARELHAALAQAGVRPPLVLVGHSLGGLHQWTYAALCPDEVVGFVLLDPTHPRHRARMQTEAKIAAGMIRALRVTMGAAAQREFDDQAACLDGLSIEEARRPPARLPVQTKYELLEHGDFETMVEKPQQDWLTLVTASRIARIAGSGHYLQRDQPGVVVEAIRDAVRGASASSATDVSAPVRHP
jgi:pimeloyl-ACP methyl ester carboxylesterase